MRTPRLIFALMYFVLAYGTIYAYGDRNYFCASLRTGRNYAAVTATLALACTLWSILASAVGSAIAKLEKRHGQIYIPVVSTLIAGAGFITIPLWIYRGYGHFLFENTWADVSCFFTEGFGLAFPFVVAPVLTVATLVQEWLVIRMHRKSAEVHF